MWRDKLITVSELLLKQSAVTAHCQGAMRWPSALKDGWCRGRAAPLPLQMSPTQTDQPDDGGGWHRNCRPFQQASLTPPALLCFQSATIKVSITLMSGPPGAHKPQKAGAKQRRCSCSAFTYWPITAGAINWSRVESCTSGPWSSPDIQIIQHLTLCVAYGRNKWNLLT